MEFEIDNSPNDSDIQEILDQLSEFNLKHIEVDRRVPIAIWCKDSKGAKIAGITGNTFGQWLEIKYLWVNESYRQNKVGTTGVPKSEEGKAVNSTTLLK